MMGIAKVTRNYQVTVPQDIRNVQGIEIGDTILFAVDGDKVDIIKINQKDMILKMAGSWKDKITEESTEYVDKIRKGWSKRTKRLGL